MAREPVRQLRRTYLRLGLGETAAAAVFCGAMLCAVAPRLGSGSGRAAVWAALVPLIVVLAQAGLYWLLARSWIGRGAMPPALRRLYRCFRVVDAVLLAAGLAMVVVLRPSVGAFVFALLIWTFGLAEYVNYFFVRLSYPAGRWFSEVGRRRTPRLAKDLRARAADIEGRPSRAGSYPG